MALVADVRDRATLAAQIEALVEGENGGLDAVVAAAGVVDAGATHAIEPAAWDAVIDVNLTGVFNVAHFTMPALCRRKGCFIAIGAAAGAFAAQGMAAYTASKHGLNGLVKALALEYGHLGVRANVISPGFVETRMAQKLLDSLSDEERIAMRKRTPLDRFAKADEVADVIAWFASDQANFANGALFALDGGVTAGWYMPPA